MSNANAQKKGGKKRHYLPEAKTRVDRLEEAFLADEDYRDLLELWGVAGRSFLAVENYRKHLLNSRDRNSKDPIKDRREQFLNRLREGRSRWGSLILSGRKRDEDRIKIDELLAKVRDDPLKFLNLCGVSPYQILAEIDLRYERQENLGPLWKKLRSARERKKDAKLLRKAEGLVKIYKPATIAFSSSHIDPASGINDTIKVVENLKHGESPSELDQKGASPNREFRVAVWRLVNETNKQMNLPSLPGSTKFSRSIHPDISVGQKAIWGSITAILMAAFHEWFKGTRDPARKVKNAYRQAGKLLSQGEQVL